MSDNQATHEREALTEAFVKQVKQALEHLYDIEYLEAHPLPVDGGSGDEASAGIGGQRLRWELSAAIESLNPGAGTPFCAPPARIYNLLSLRYVERRTVQQAAQESGLSERQAHRDLRRGEERVAVILWERRSEFSSPDASAMRISSLESEMARLHARPRSVELGDLLKQAQEAVAPLAAQRDVRIQVELPDEPVTLSLDPVMAEQVLVNTLSHAVEQAFPGPFHLTLELEGKRAIMSLRYFLDSDAPSEAATDLVILQLADRLGWSVNQKDRLDGARIITVHMTVRGPTVLVVDDNEGLVDLLERYLTDQACRVVGAANGQQGLRMARELVPDAIILDVMMPEMHGWEFLQRLRTHSEMADVPVIICSVINNPQLAYCLGASVFLPKPVSRNDVLQALQEVHIT